MYNYSKNVKYLGVTQTKFVQNSYAENYPMLMKDIKEDLNK